MLNRTLRVTALLALVAAVAAPVAVAAPASSSPPAPETVAVSSLKGDAGMDYPVADQEVRVSVDARSTYTVDSIPQRSWGTFRILRARDGTLYWGEFNVDCLTEPLLTKCMAPVADAKIVGGGYTLRDRSSQAVSVKSTPGADGHFGGTGVDLYATV